jgi:pSer/pThr/pTyr-binding forkhead associated (FHA) protein
MERIEVETHDGLQRIPLDKPRITIGRLPGNDIVLPYTQISRHHAEIRQRGDDWWIIDLGSTNGLRVGGRQVKEHVLRGGDHVILAPSIILHYISQRAAKPKTVEGSTQELPVLPVTPVQPARATASSAADEPSTTSASVLAAAAAISAPHRRIGMTPPPSVSGTPGNARPVLPVESPPPGVDERDLWLVDSTPGASLASPPTPAANPQTNYQAPPSAPGRDLPMNSPFSLMRQQQAKSTTALPRKPILISCPTCGASTAPDSPYCWSCRQTIAQPCAQCRLFLLPIQQKCPRCETPNPHAVRR